MIEISPRDLTTIKRILVKHVSECEVRVFGSRIKGITMPHSDLDLVVLGKEKISRSVLSSIKFEFESSPLPFRVDILDWHRISPEFRKHIEKEYEIIHSSDEVKSLPKDWVYWKISEIADVITGGTPKKTIPAYWDGEIPWLTPKDLSVNHWRFISRGERNATKLGIENCRSRIVPQKTVLVTSRAPVGYIALANNPLSTNQGVISLIVNKVHEPEFVYYLLLNNQEYLTQHISGPPFQELSVSTLKSLLFLMPPLKDQKSIGQILGTLDDKIEMDNPKALSLRDTLLPKLISGEIDTAQALELISQAMA